MIAPWFSPRSTLLVALQQIALAALVTLLLVVWLHIPDANSLEVLLSVVVALIIAVVAGMGESVLALRLTNRAATARRLFLGTVAVLIAALLWYGVALGSEKISANDGLRAGYLNSRLPAAMRNVFSYGHLSSWLGWFWAALRWFAAGLLAALAFAWITCEEAKLGALAILRSAAYWLSLLLFGLVGWIITGLLMGWTPSHGVSVEVLSLVVRLLLAIVLNAVVIAFLLQAMAHAVFRVQSPGGADPATSQSRTAVIP